jgi:hypothetical protein
MNTMKGRTVGVAWYDPEQWDRLRDISEDAHELEDTYEEWKSHALQKIKDLEKQGFTVQKVDVDTEELLGWCNSFRMPVNGHSRTEFMTKRLRELLRNKS